MIPAPFAQRLEDCLRTLSRTDPVTDAERAAHDRLVARADGKPEPVQAPITWPEDRL